MGEQRKKFKCWHLFILSVLLMLAFFVSGVGLYLLDSDANLSTAIGLTPAEDPNATNTIERYWGQGGRVGGGFADKDEENKIYYIREPLELAYMASLITSCGRVGTEEDYTGYTFVLQNDINLYERTTVDGEKIYPYWTPIDIGTLGKNNNIHFDGRGADGKSRKIIGMRIKVDANTPMNNVGFFSNLVGGVFENVIFENPTIVYDYSATSVPEKIIDPEHPGEIIGNPARPHLPTDVCVGIVAGSADSTYIHNVEIVNPQIEFVGNNVNAHNFCVGAAVGKLSFNRGVNVLNQWGLDRVKVYKTAGAEQPKVSVSINQGTIVDTAHDLGEFGRATYGYIGGLVGVNVSSRIINSSIVDMNVAPEIAADVNGTYYIGGLVGLTTQIASALDQMVAAGLYNNLIKNLTLADVDTGSRYCGNLVGRVYHASWAYNNLIIGVTNGYNRLWEDVSNDEILIDKTDVHADNCVGHILGAIDPYYFNGTNYIGGNCTSDSLTNPTYCPSHQKPATPITTYKYGNIDYNFGIGLSEYNFTANSQTDFSNSEFAPNAAQAYSITLIDGENTETKAYNKFELMSEIDQINEGYFNQHGLLFNAALPFLKYEKGLSTDTEYDQLLQVAYQLCTWRGATTSEINLGDYFGTKHRVTFNADSKIVILDDGVSTELAISKGYFEGINGPLEIEYNEKQIIKEPVMPVCEGYDLVGWKLVDPDENDAKYLDQDGYYFRVVNGECVKVDKSNGDAIYERIAKDREFKAIWKKKKLTVRYWLAEGVPFTVPNDPNATPVTEEVTFNTHLNKGVIYQDQIVSNEGLEFVGWYLKENLPVEEQDAREDWKWDFETDKMPGHNLDLYVGWRNKAKELSRLINDPLYISYYNNYDKYFTYNSGTNFHDAFEIAQDACRPESNFNNTQLKTFYDNLIAAYENLRIEPNKMLDLDAFDDSLPENAYPFVYDYTTYSDYLSFKETVKINYPDNEDLTDDDKSNVGAFVTYYNELNQRFNALKANIKPSFEEIGGIESNEFRALKNRYEIVKSKFDNLMKGEYVNYNMGTLVEAAGSAKDLWENRNNKTLTDIQLAVANFESTYDDTINNKRNDTTTENKTPDNGIGGTRKPANKMPVSPVVLSVTIVAVLAVSIYGYIGADVILNKRRLGKQNLANVNPHTSDSQTADEDDTYI